MNPESAWGERHLGQTNAVCSLYAFMHNHWIIWFTMKIKKKTSKKDHKYKCSSVQSLSGIWLFATPWIEAHQASLPITNSRNLLKPMSIESVMPSSHLVLCNPLLLLSPIPPIIRVFSRVNSLHEVAKVLEFQLQHQSFQWTPRTDLL